MYPFTKSIWTPTGVPRSTNDARCGVLLTVGVLPAGDPSTSTRSQSQHPSKPCSETISRHDSSPTKNAEILRLQYLLVEKMEIIDQMEHKLVLSETEWKTKVQHQQSFIDDLKEKMHALTAVLEEQQREIISLKAQRERKEENLKQQYQRMESMEHTMRMKDREIWTLRAKLNKSMGAPPGLSPAPSLSVHSPHHQPIKVQTETVIADDEEEEEERNDDLKEDKVTESKDQKASYRLMAMDPVQREMELLFGRDKRLYVQEMCRISGYTTTCHVEKESKMVKAKGGRLRSRNEWKCTIEIGLIGIKTESVAESKKKAINECYGKCAELIRKQEL